MDETRTERIMRAADDTAFVIGEFLKRIIKVGVLVVILIGATVALTWNVDWWPIRDRLAHIASALFGTYVTEECRQDPENCKDRSFVPAPGKKEGADVGTVSLNQVAATSCPPGPALQVQCDLKSLFDHFNKHLYQGRLPEPVLTLQRRKGWGGYFARNRFTNEDGETVHEIAINPSIFRNQSMLFVASVVVHELEHLRDFEEGRPTKDGHGPGWQKGMRAVGLEPTDKKGRSGRHASGRFVSHRIVKGGLFERVAKMHPLMARKKMRWFE